MSVILVCGFVASRQDFADGGKDVRLVEELMVRLLEFDACEKEKKFGLRNGGATFLLLPLFGRNSPVKSRKEKSLTPTRHGNLLERRPDW